MHQLLQPVLLVIFLNPFQLVVIHAQLVINVLTLPLIHKSVLLEAMRMLVKLHVLMLVHLHSVLIINLMPRQLAMVMESMHQFKPLTVMNAQLVISVLLVS